MLCSGMSLTFERDREPPKKGEQDSDCTRKACCSSMEVGEEGMTPEWSPQKSGQSSKDGKKAQESRGVEEVACRSDD